MKTQFGITTLCFCGAAMLSATALCAADPVQNEAPKAPESAKAEAPAANPFLQLPEVIAEGNGIKITREDIRASLMKQIPEGQQIPPLSKEQMERLAFGQSKMLFFMQALTQEIKKAKFDPSEAQIKAFLNEMIAKDPRMGQALAAQGKTVDSLTQEILANPDFKQNLVEQMFVQKTVVIPEITESDAKKYYDANRDKFTTQADDEKTLRASHILIAVQSDADDAAKKAAETKAQEILAKVKADPASFEKLAAEVSDCPSGKMSGGDLGPFQAEQMVPEFSKAVVALKPNEISGIVKTQFGYHIIRRNAPQAARVIPFDEIKDRIVEVLKQEAGQKAFLDYMEKIEKEYGFKLYIPEVKREAL